VIRFRHEITVEVAKEKRTNQMEFQLTSVLDRVVLDGCVDFVGFVDDGGRRVDGCGELPP
jgi:hypothetical protein